MSEPAANPLERILAEARKAATASTQHVACSQCGLSNLCLPRELNLDEVSEFERIVRRSRPIQADEHLFMAGDPFETVLAVRAGCFKSYVIDEDGEERVLGFHLPGEIIGLEAINGRQHRASVMALDTSAVCSLSFEQLSEMARKMPDLQTEIFRVMSERIGELETIAGDLTAEQRLGLFLLSISERFARRGYSASEFQLAMSRRDIASYLRLATETVSRVLARFQERGWVDADRKRIRLLDIDALRESVGCSHMHALAGSE